MLSKVVVSDQNNNVIDYFKQKLFSIVGKFDVLNENEESLCEVEGKWSDWYCRFNHKGRELAHVSKKCNGIGKELFTSSDNYILELNPEMPYTNNTRKLIIAAVMCIDMVLKE